MGVVADYRGDQAAGLRRLFGCQSTRVITFVGGSAGVGRSSVVANLAAALARQGKEVLVLDESARDGVAACFGALARNDLLQVINREKAMTEVVLTVMPGVRVLPASRAVAVLGKLTVKQQDGLVAALTGMERRPDYVLVDASLDHPLGFSPFGLAAHETVIVVPPSAGAITEAYALIKKVSLAYASRHYRVLVNKVRAVEEGRTIFGNIARVTHARKLARLEYAGCIPFDENMSQAARLCQPAIALYPEAPGSRVLRTVANAVIDWPVEGGEDGGLEQFLQQLLHLSQRFDPVAIYA